MLVVPGARFSSGLCLLIQLVLLFSIIGLTRFWTHHKVHALLWETDQKSPEYMYTEQIHFTQNLFVHIDESELLFYSLTRNCFRPLFFPCPSVMVLFIALLRFLLRYVGSQLYSYSAMVRKLPTTMEDVIWIHCLSLWPTKCHTTNSNVIKH